MAGKEGIRAVAARAGVSITTVSHALSGRGQVSATTREKVRRVADELGYRPDPLARAMRSDRRAVLGFVSEEIATTPYAGSILLGAQEAASERGSMLMIVNVARDAVDDPQIDALLAHQVDAVIFASASNRVVTTPARLDPTRTVLVDSRDPLRPMPSVMPDEYGIGATAARRLLAGGHRDVVHVTVDEDAPAVHGRERGFREVLTAAGLEPRVVTVPGPGTTAAGRRATAEALDGGPVTAVFAFNDQMAMGTYQEAARRGLSVPDDLSVVGVDDLQLVAEALLPGLTTIALPHEEMGRRAVEIAFGLPEAPTTEVAQLPGHLVERGSVADLG